MISISKKQAGQRWDTITPQLREALFSDVNADFVWNLCQNEHLTKGKSYQVAEFAGYVLLGFLHPEDLAGELVSSIDLPTPLAKTISDQINSRIFTPLRADIDKVYSPPSKMGDVPTAAGPKSISLSDIGWSKQPVVASVVNANIPKPAAVASTTTAPKAPTPTPVPTLTSAIPTPAPAPMMLHEDTTFKSAEKNLNFSLAKPGDTNEMKMASGAPQAAMSARAAVLEFGTVPVPTPKSTVPKPPLSSVPRPLISAGARNVSQITATIAVPMTPKPLAPTAAMNAVPVPRPPQAPITPKAPLPQLDKAIVKDFL